MYYFFLFLADYRQIVLGNVEGKLFWSLIAQGVYHLVTKNKLIDTTFQKGSIQKMAGCWEHTSMIWAGLKDARSKGRSLSTIWLDLANAYGSVPHVLIIFALRRYKIPEEWITLVIKYYDGLWGRTSASGVSSDWHRYEKGIFAGCTISIILFIAASNVILEHVSRIGLPQYNLSNTNTMPVLCAFKDDVSLMTRSATASKIALERTVIVLKWARMKLKPQKSRSLVIRKGKSIDEQPFKVGEEIIPSIQKEPLKTLGRIYNNSVTDKIAREDLRKKIIDLVQKLDKSLLTGIMKVWVYQNLLLAMIGWPLMIYEILLSWVEAVETYLNSYLRKWLGVSKNMSSVLLYCDETPCLLPIHGIVTEFKKRKVSGLLQLRQSKDQSVRANVPQLYSGKKWKVADEVDRIESRLNVVKVMGSTQTGRTGFGFQKETKRCRTE